MTAESQARREGGFALFVVLVGVALLCLLLETMLLLSNRSVETVADDVAHTQLECAVQAGIIEGMKDLFALQSTEYWSLDGTPRDIQFNGITISVSISNENGKVNLNSDGLTLITNLFAAAGLDHTDAQTMADRVLDWREPGQLKRLNGAKADDYRAAGLHYYPRGGPFQSIDELNLVLGITPSLYDRLEPAITVYRVLPLPAPHTASPLVLRALGYDRAKVEAILAARRQGTAASDGDFPPLNIPAHISAMPGTVFTITAVVHEAGAIVDRSEIIRFTGNPKDPFWILSER